MCRRLKILEQFLVQVFQAAITDAIHADLLYLAWRSFPSPKIRNARLEHHFLYCTTLQLCYLYLQPDSLISNFV